MTEDDASNASRGAARARVTAAPAPAERLLALAADPLRQLRRRARQAYLLAYLRGRGAQVDPSVRVFGRVHVGGNPANLRIGRGVVLNEGVFLNARGPLSIGDGTHLSPYAQVQTGQLQVDAAGRRHRAAAVSIGENVWVAAGAIITGGVTIGENSVVAAGAVVTRDVKPGVLVGGVPAEVIRELELDERPGG
jgi:acetyltransferase-like isoleucine patch superfamily enzyme